MLLEAVLAAVLAMPIFYEDRAPEIAHYKRAQLVLVAHAVADAAAGVDSKLWPGSKHELALVMLTIARHETGLSLRIHAGACKPHECDRGLARGLWQMHASAATSRANWERLAGWEEDRTRHAAREAARAIVRQRWLCRSLEQRGVDWVQMTLAAYAGRGCRGWFRGLDARVNTYRRLIATAPART